MKPNPIEVGQRIKEIRIEEGLSQKEFAKKTGSTIPAISNWENGRNLPNNERLKAIADLVEITVDELLYGNIERRLKNILINDINNYGKLYDEIMNILSYHIILAGFKFKKEKNEKGEVVYKERNVPELFEARKERALRFLEDNFDIIASYIKGKKYSYIDEGTVINDAVSILSSKNIPHELSFMGKYHSFNNLFFDSTPNRYLLGESIETMKKYFLEHDPKVKGDADAYRKAVDMKYQHKLYDISTDFRGELDKLLLEYKSKLDNYE